MKELSDQYRPIELEINVIHYSKNNLGMQNDVYLFRPNKSVYYMYVVNSGERYMYIANDETKGRWKRLTDIESIINAYFSEIKMENIL